MIKILCIVMVLAPLFAGIVAGIFGKVIGRSGAHSITILGVFVAFVASLIVSKVILMDHQGPIDVNLYAWVMSASNQFYVGFLVDQLSACMILLVTFVSLLVHIYSIGYMADDPGYQRFFSYMSLFTFAMLMLVLANNLATLFFGWEGVGLVSYLLIGFWFTKPTAAFGSLKAFLVNRVGDMGMILGIAAVLTYFGSLSYQDIFSHREVLANQYMTLLPGCSASVATVICILLFIGAAGKSAQMPLHVWLPESMEGPTPISAMIHAATMVTAGVYLVARFSPLFELSTTALSVVLVVGATTCFFCGLLGVIQNDIKRVIAYSTLSQLGYMMAGVGASAYSAGMFHLFTHGCFKALLFLAAGSVIIANHHNQDMRKMGGLYKHMPITYITFLIGALALCAIPPFSGFYSKDTIIEAVGVSTIPGAHYAYYCVLLGAFVTALYTFRAFFLTFHGTDRVPLDVKAHLHESPWVMTLPLILLAIPSVLLGYYLISPLIYQQPDLLGNAIFVLPDHNVILRLLPEFHGALPMALHSVFTAPFWLAVAGIIVAWVFSIGKPIWADFCKDRFSWVYYVLEKKYGFDDFNQLVFVEGTQRFSAFLLRVFDVKLVDHFCVNGSGRLITWLSKVLRHLQTGYLYHYAFVMVVGLLVFLTWRLV